MPASRPACKIGQLKIRKPRGVAAKAIGRGVNLRRFQREALGDGAPPL